jgi:hypothetical protein
MLEFHRIGVLAAVMWTAPAVLSLVASLFAFCGVPSDATDEIGSMLAIVGAIGLGFAIGSYAIASALGEIALALASEVSNRGTVEAQVNQALVLVFTEETHRP